MTVVTRFAPSPTGYLHIGGARTALFNLLFARGRGGRFLLRVEDTDRERSTEAAVQAIFDGLNWLGLQPDEDPVFQHARAERHREAVEQLLASGRAYRDYMTPEELETERGLAHAAGRVFRSPWRDRDPAEAPADAPFVVRFRGPAAGDTIVDDLVQGTVRFPNVDLDDLVLLRSGGSPTYNLAVVVDDHDMGVTHVIRGDDHLNNAARQSQIYDALGWERPRFAHIPLIYGPDGAKLSKRHGAQAVSDFAEMGYLPEAMRNYLARLGWSHGDAEIFSDAQAIEWFDLADVGRAPARLDFDKLAHINAHYLRLADDERLTGLVLESLERRGEPTGPEVEARVRQALPLVKERAKTVEELTDCLAFALCGRPLQLEPKQRAALDGEAVPRLRRLAAELEQTPDFAPPALERLLQAFAAREGVGLGKIGPALRGALAGRCPAPGLAETLSALGREEALGRLRDALPPGA
ncbi:MAG: glutamate--tRNA ligase [Pseudomonadota bacterium]|nr:glutamate--tRNA ligase [Pseudomonadota bacterium]